MRFRIKYDTQKFSNLPYDNIGVGRWRLILFNAIFAIDQQMILKKKSFKPLFEHIHVNCKLHMSSSFFSQVVTKKILDELTIS